MTSDLTVGIDIGTSSVKAIAADGDGNVVARARIPHPVRVPSPDRFEHDAAVAWRAGPVAAFAALGDVDVRGVSVSAMVPSLAAVDADGVPRPWGLLYGDERGGTREGATDPSSEGFVGFLRYLAAAAPDAHGFWPAQTVANYALAGAAVLDTITAALAHPLFDWTGWDEQLAGQLGVTVAQLPRLVPTGSEAGRIGGDGPALASGCVDAFAEQLVAGADEVGDVLVLLGTTLIVWVVGDADAAVPGYVSVPHTVPDRYLFGGPSNAGGLFRDWVVRMLGAAVDRGDAGEPERVPVWAPYPRGERVPLADSARRATLDGLDLTHGPSEVLRAADEASAFVVRRAVEAARVHAGVTPRRIVATGGGTRVDGWVQALADATGLPVDCVAEPDGAALGSAWLARIAAGLEEPTAMGDGRRWARPGRRVEPRAAWQAPTAARYERFLALSGPAGA
jgi:xylulokinase